MVSVGSSRDSRRQVNEESKRQSGRGKSRYWSLRLKLGSTPIKVHLQKPEKPYQDIDSELYYHWKRGRNVFFKSAAKPNGCFLEKTRQQDVIDAYQNPGVYDLEAKDLDGKRAKDIMKMEYRPYYSVSGWIEHWFHLVEKESDRKGDDGKLRKISFRERCTGKSCKYCVDEVPKVYGNRFFYDFSNAAWRDAVLPMMEKVERFAKDGGYLYPVCYVCEECKTDLIDMTQGCFACGGESVGIDPERHMAVCQNKKCNEEWSLLEYEDEKLLEQVSQEMKCKNKKCKHVGFPELVLAHTEGAQEWEAMSIFDIQFQIKKTGNKDKAETVIVAWEFKEPDERLFDPKYQGEGEAAEVWAKRNKEQIDLDAVHAPDPAIVQAQYLGVPNPFGGAGGRVSKHSFKHYSRDAKGEDEDEGDEDSEE